MKRLWPVRRPARRNRTIQIDLTAGDEATRARKRAEQRWSRVRRVADEHERLRRENHFADRVRHALEGH